MAAVPNMSLRYCPRCGAQDFHSKSEKHHVCGKCDFTLYQNVAAAAGAFIRVQDEILVIERGEDPGKGQYDVPGGFIDHNESLEDGLAREVREELGIQAQSMRYIAGFPNQYFFKDVLYHTMDVFFEISLLEKPQLKINENEVNRVEWLKVTELPADKFAFPSVRRVINQFFVNND